MRQAGAFRIGDTAGTLDNIVSCKCAKLQPAACRFHFRGHCWSGAFLLTAPAYMQLQPHLICRDAAALQAVQARLRGIRQQVGRHEQ